MLATNRDTLYGEIASLREALDIRTEELRQIKETFAPQLAFPREWKLTSTETAMLGALYAAKSGVLSKDALHMAISGIEVETEPKIVDVFICKIRRKLKGSGIVIETCWGDGYRLPPESRRACGRALAGEPAEDPPAPAIEPPREVPAEEAQAEAEPLLLLAEPEPQPRSEAMSEPQSARNVLSLPSALLNIQVTHPMDALVVIDAAMTLLDRARRDIVGETGGAVLPAAAPVAQLEPPRPEKREKAERARKACQEATPAEAAPAPAPQSPAADNAELIELNGVTIDTTPGAESVSFAGKTMEVTTRQARLTTMLARTMPSPMAREILAKKWWNGSPPATADTALSAIAADASRALEAVDLEIQTVRGVGYVLRRKGEG